MVDPYYDEEHPVIAELRKENADLKADRQALIAKVILSERIVELQKENADLKAEVYKLKGLNTLEGRWRAREGLNVHPSWKKEQS